MNPYEEWFAKNIFDKNENSATITRAAFQAGAASRDAELTSAQKTIESMRDSLWELSKERDQLRSTIELLRKAMNLPPIGCLMQVQGAWDKGWKC